MLQCGMPDAAMQTKPLRLASGIRRLPLSTGTVIGLSAEKGNYDVKNRYRRTGTLQLAVEPAGGHHRPPVNGER